MQIRLSEIAKRYHRWIFQEVDYLFEAPGAYGITGSNGTGKSTLLAITAGYVTPTRGTVRFLSDNGNAISQDRIHQHLSIAAPYISVVGELSIEEHLKFHTRFKSLIDPLNMEDFFQISGLDGYRSVLVSHLSSGLQQRFKLALALLCESPIIFLDEPTSYLDEKSKIWFAQLFHSYTRNRLLIMASNDASDLALTQIRLEIESFGEIDREGN